MKKLTSLFITAIVISLFSSCALHGGYIANSASLSSANFSYTEHGLNGSATATYVFGFGGLAKKTLVDEAKEDMLRNSKLADNRALANITVNFKSSYYFFFQQVTCTVTADVVEFSK